MGTNKGLIAENLLGNKEHIPFPLHRRHFEKLNSLHTLTMN